MKYPPKELGLMRPDDKILWMLDNNSYCRWKDFLKNPIKIPSATLSKYIKRLIKKEFIEKNFDEETRPVYKITPKGEAEIHRLYSPDFETLLQIELDKNLNLINNFTEFFEVNNIDNIEIQIEFVKLASLITYDKLKNSFIGEDQFNKLLLFIVLNHPKFYPYFNLDIRQFIDEYSQTPPNNLTEHQIGFFLEKVIDEDIYGVNFHKLEVSSIANNFYFTEKSYLGSVFQNTVDEQLKNLFLIGNLTDRKISEQDLMKTYGDIAYDMVEKTKQIHPDLKNSLYDLIDRYRNNIRQQITKETVSKIRDYSTILGLPYTTELDKTKSFKEKSSFIINERKYLKDGKRIEASLESYKNFGSSIKNLRFESKENLYKKAWNFYEKEDYISAVDVINKLLEFERSAELLYWKSEIQGLNMHQEALALKNIEEGIKINPMPSGYNFYRLKAQILSHVNQYEKALKSIDDAIEIDSQPELLRTKVQIIFDLQRYDEIIEIAKIIPNDLKKLISKDLLKNLYKIKANNDMKILDIALLYDPENYESYYKKAVFAFKRHQIMEDALEYINKAIEIAENKKIYEIPYGFNIIQAYGLKCKILRKRGEDKEAVKHYEKAKSMIKEDNPLPLEVGEILDGIMTVDEILSEYDVLIKNYGEKNPEFLNYKARYLYKIKKYDDAEELYELIYSIDSKSKYNIISPDYTFDWFEMLLRRKKFAEAADVLKNKDHWNLLYGDIERFAEYGGFETYLELISEIVYDPKLLKEYVNPVLMAIKNGLFDHAKNIIKVGISLRPQENKEDLISDFIKALKEEFSKLIQFDIKEENYQNAYEFLDNYLQYDNQEPEVYRYKAVIFLRQNSPNEALENINKAISFNENNANYYQIQAIAFYNLNKYNKALLSVNKAIELNPSEFKNYGLKADILQISNKLNQAYNTLMQGRELSKDPDLFITTMAEILERLGKNEEALKEINRAIEIYPNNKWVYYKKAYILGQKLEEFKEALVNINKALEFDSDDGIYNADKINYLINLQKFDEAYGTLERFKENIPEPDQVLGWIYEQQALDYANSGKKDEAIDLIKKVIDMFPDWSEYYHTYGKILMDFGDYEKALTKFEKAKELHFTPKVTYIEMGKCLLELKRYEDAIENLKIGRNAAAHSVKSIILTEDDKRVTVDNPQKELIKEAERYINEAELKLKNKR